MSPCLAIVVVGLFELILQQTTTWSVSVEQSMNMRARYKLNLVESVLSSFWFVDFVGLMMNDELWAGNEWGKLTVRNLLGLLFGTRILLQFGFTRSIVLVRKLHHKSWSYEHLTRHERSSSRRRWFFCIQRTFLRQNKDKNEPRTSPAR